MSTWRKKPVEVEARQITRENAADLAKWSGGTFFMSSAPPYLFIPTLEGRMTAGMGDWIIRGVQGEFYPCKPDIFAATYELVSEGASDGE